MAKRTRYGNKPTSKRGARPSASARPAAPTGPVAARPVAARPISAVDDALPVDLPDDAPIRASSASLTEAEELRAAELEAQLAALERAAMAESIRRKTRAQAGDAPHLVDDINAPLSVRMAHEYAYVARDVKRIALTASLMVAILAVLAILVNVLGVITL